MPLSILFLETPWLMWLDGGGGGGDWVGWGSFARDLRRRLLLLNVCS